MAAAAGQALLMDTVSVTALRALLPPPAEAKVQIPAYLADCKVHMPAPAVYDRLLVAHGGGAAS
ncbi:hypothetical protein G7K71_12490 [Desulfofundulus sp. TPOSR]|uniref:hypothetical protein n=1 Tax=Desulfofundulus sp. TPOSR TaxID=2714340 RepID=UPI00140DD181|nr:hypothetical protein [Desulfofundulus sp. TPOSR]NHM27780.1 hypothetical protein [Desulfofundulus sp. TPOSR]